MIRLIIISFLTLLIAVSSPAETIRGRVLWVQDGDTVALTASNGLWFRVRLWGIDAPESDQPGGQAALTELIRLVGRKQVTVDIKDRDRYGRLVGVILYRKRDINLEMLRLGQAWHYRQYAPKAARYADAELEARRKKLGLWAEADPIAPWEWRREQRRKKKKPDVVSEETTPGHAGADLSGMLHTVPAGSGDFCRGFGLASDFAELPRGGGFSCRAFARLESAGGVRQISHL